MSRILVAISSIVAARRMIDPVSDLARRLAGEVLIVHVSRPSSGQMREEEHSDGERAINALRDGLQQREISVQTLLLFSDDIARAILNTAADRQATLIVLGLTTKNVFARLIAGNVPVELIKNTRVPVLLLPPDWESMV
jgi:nucleotide-binding universal stress UspA family protein